MDEYDEERLSQAIRQRLSTMPVGAYLDAMVVARELAAHFPGLASDEIQALVKKQVGLSALNVANEPRQSTLAPEAVAEMVHECSVHAQHR